MLEIRKELIALINWEKTSLRCSTRTELDAIAHRILRMAELMRETREIADRN